MTRAAITLLIASVASPALAQTQVEMNRSAMAAFVRADSAMNREWSRTTDAMRRLDGQAGGARAAALLESQRAWLRFRDAQCVVEGGRYAGGSLQGMTITNCRTRLTEDRRVQLRDLTRQE